MPNSHMHARRESVVQMLAADERRLGHADADVRAELRQRIYDALDLRMLAIRAGMSAIGRPDDAGRLADGTLVTSDLADIRDAVEALPGTTYRFAVAA